MNLQPDPLPKKMNKRDNKLIFTSVIVSVVIIGAWLYTMLTLQEWKTEDRASFGDMFGSVNALFSGLALAGIIITIILQSKELSLQRQELIDTRAELKRTATAQENSEKALTKQAEYLKIAADLDAYGTLSKYYLELYHLKSTQAIHSELTAVEIMDRQKHYQARFEDIVRKSEALEKQG